MRHGVLRNNKGIIIHNVVQRLQRHSPFSHGKGKLEEKRKSNNTSRSFACYRSYCKKPRLCQTRKQKSDACWSKLILSERAQKTLAQIKAHAKALRSPSEKAERRGKGEKRGSVLSRLIIHFRQLATNYLPFSSICPSHDRKANVWQAHRWVGNSSLMYGKLLEFAQYLMMKNSRWDKGLGRVWADD